MVLLFPEGQMSQPQLDQKLSHRVTHQGKGGTDLQPDLFHTQGIFCSFFACHKHTELWQLIHFVFHA